MKLLQRQQVIKIRSRITRSGSGLRISNPMAALAAFTRLASLALGLL